MKNIRCIVADDEELAREIMENYISKLNHLQLLASCSNGADVYNALKQNTADLLFLDIKMPQLTGIELLRTLKNPPLVILTTAYREYALEGYELNVIDYLLKPISFERFLKAVDKYEFITGKADTALSNTVTHDPQAFIYVKSDKKMVRIILKDILFIEGLKDYVKIHTIDKEIVTYQTLTYFEETLPANRFTRVHRSFIISPEHISSYSANEIIVGKQQVPIGSTYASRVSGILGADSL
jgi:DNA-binding LytR/AlgR family response regulator